MNAPIQQFNPSQIAIIDHNGGKWLTSEQLGLALGYLRENARTSINRLYNRHIEEFSEHDSTEVKLTTVDGKLRESRIFSQPGCILASFFANTPNAKAFRAWAKDKLAEPAADAVALEKLKAAYLSTRPDMARLLRYADMGLNQAETAKLLGNPTYIKAV
ncbi:hypothetical protein EGK75_07380 [Neisseria weixii]|uniref:Bro-N domain-containing protein n=1 Tax=Neisseria weixii TaxID=1853276 RepID=A0A3N4MSI0_9NEIS|nr:BRO family protein [Neisseria weixii]RPD86198.1 hypothetical protein EGK74_08095 [Neisseria weixii]RPD87181.1 hypothetical protein EGK75_07380 [Neisseria weixii]